MNREIADYTNVEVRPPLPERVLDLISSREILKFSYQFPERFFGHLWSYGVPLVIMGVGAKLQLSWTPEYFVHNHGHQVCTLEETSTGSTRQATVAEFFTSYGNYQKSRPVEKLKVSRNGFSLIFTLIFTAKGLATDCGVQRCFSGSPQILHGCRTNERVYLC